MNEYMKWWLGLTEDEYLQWCSDVVSTAIAVIIGLTVLGLGRLWF